MEKKPSKAQMLLEEIKALFLEDYEIIKKCTDKNYTTISSPIESNFFDLVIIADKNPDKKSASNLYKETYAKKGVYVFKIIKDIKFDRSIYLQNAAQPNDINLREYKAGDILYVGKSLAIGPRIREHHKVEPSDTSSLVLGAEMRKFLSGHYMIYMFSLKKEFKSTDKKPFSFEKLIINGVEAVMHEKMKPKIGSSKA
jgi:hypothetical protein